MSLYVCVTLHPVVTVAEIENASWQVVSYYSDQTAEFHRESDSTDQAAAQVAAERFASEHDETFVPPSGSFITIMASPAPDRQAEQFSVIRVYLGDDENQELTAPSQNIHEVAREALGYSQEHGLPINLDWLYPTTLHLDLSQRAATDKRKDTDASRNREKIVAAR